MYVQYIMYIAYRMQTDTAWWQTKREHRQKRLVDIVVTVVQHSTDSVYCTTSGPGAGGSGSLRKPRAGTRQERHHAES